jgi:hypothetical protein
VIFFKSSENAPKDFSREFFDLLMGIASFLTALQLGLQAIARLVPHSWSYGSNRKKISELKSPESYNKIIQPFYNLSDRGASQTA